MSDPGDAAATPTPAMNRRCIGHAPKSDADNLSRPGAHENGLHLIRRPTSCDLYCSAGGRLWPPRNCRSLSKESGYRSGAEDTRSGPSRGSTSWSDKNSSLLAAHHRNYRGNQVLLDGDEHAENDGQYDTVGEGARENRRQGRVLPCAPLCPPCPLW